MANSDKNIRITTSKNKTTYPNIVFTGSAAGSSVITLEVLDDNTLSFTSNEGQVFSIDSNLSTGTIWAVSDISGIPLLSASAGGTIGFGVYGGIIGIGQTNPIYKLDLKGSFGLASSNDGLYNFIFTNSAVSGSNSFQVRSANSILLYNSGNTFYTGLKSNAAANITYTLPTTDGASGQFLQTNGSAILTWATATGSGGTGSTTGVGQGAQYEMAYYSGTGLSVVGSNTFTNNTATGVVSITHSTVSTDYSTGAFKVTGGVGIGGSLYVGGIGASIVGVTFSNSSITRGTWNGTAISPTYGGTGLNNSSATGLLQYSTGTASVITTSSALATIISDKTGTAGKLVFSTSPVFSTGVDTDSGSFSVFNTTATTINAFGAATTLSVGAATGKFTHNSTDNSSSISTGSVVVLGGAGIAKSVSIGGYLQLFNSTNYTAFVSSATGNTVYTLPATSPATGSSVLQSTSAGVMSWVPMVASSGSGLATTATNVNVNTLGNPNSFHPLLLTPAQSSAGSAVSANSTLVYNPSTDILNTPGLAVTSGVNATNVTSGAFQVRGGIGITGNAFIGGTINVTSTSVSNISNVSFTNGIITSGSWSGSTITAFYGGTGLQGPTAIGDLIVANTATTWSRYATSATSGQVLTSNGTGSAPTWQAVPASAASSVAVAPTTVNGSFFVTAVNTSNSSGLGLSTITTFVVNPSTGLVSLSGLAVTNTTASTNTTSGALIVSGGLGLAGNAFIGGTINIASTSTSVISGISFVNGAITVGAWNSSVIAPQYGGTGLNNSSATGLLQYSAGTASVITTSSALANIISDDTGSGALVFATNPVLVTPTLGVATATSINKVAFTAPTTSATLTLVDGSTLITAGANSLTLTTTATTNATFPSGTKTLVATDVTSLSSLSTVGVISSGTWSGSTITAFYGGTGLQGPSAIGDLIVANTATTWSRYATSATSGQVLTSNGTGSAPTWQAVPASAASSVAVAPTTVSGSFFIPVVNSASSAGLGLSSVSSLVINPFNGLVTVSGLAVTNSTNSSSKTTGAFTVTGGLGVTGNAFIGGTINVESTSTSVISGVSFANGAVTVGAWNGTAIAPLYGGTGQNFSASSGILKYTTGTASLVTAPSGAIVGTTDSQNLTNKTYNNLTITAPATNATLTIADTTTFATSGAFNLTLTTTAATNVTLPRAGTLTTTGNNLSVFASTTSSQLIGIISDPTGTAGKLVFSTSPTFTTSVATDSASLNVFNTTATTVNAFQAGTAISLGAATGTVTLNNATTLHNQTTASTSISTGAIVVNGGVGIGLSASIGGRLQMFNSSLYTAFVGAQSGVNTTYTLPTTSPATGSSVLQSTSGGVMSWVPMTAGGGPSGTINSSTINNIAYYSAATTLSGDSVATGNYFQYNGTTNGLNVAHADNEFSPSANTGLLRIGTGATNYVVRKALAVISTNNAWTDGDLLVLGLGKNFADTRVGIDYRGYIQIGVPGTGFTLPVTNGTSGQVLTANTNGVASWTTVSGSSGAGSGTVAIPGAQYQVAAYYHSATGASVSGSTTFTNNTATGIVNITHATESTTSTTGALTVAGGAGIAKSLFVGTTLSVGTTPSYNVPNNLASFVSTVDSYNQLIIQNKSSGTSASANLVVNNNLSTDNTNYGEIGMNSSNFSGTGALGATNAVYLAATSGPLVLGTTTTNPIRFAVNNGATDTIYIHEAGTAISVFTNLDLRTQNDVRFFNSGNTFFTAIQAANNTASYTLSLPAAPVGSGASVIVTGSDGQMFYAAPGSGIAFSNATANTPIIRAKRPIALQFSASYTPAAAGADTVILRVPESATDGTTVLTYNLRRFQVRVETPSAGSSRLQLERSSTDTGTFTLAATGSSHIGGFGVTIVGAGIYLTSVTSFSGTLVTSGNLLRLNWTLLNATHANFSVNLILEEV